MYDEFIVIRISDNKTDKIKCCAGNSEWSANERWKVGHCSIDNKLYSIIVVFFFSQSSQYLLTHIYNQKDTYRHISTYVKTHSHKRTHTRKNTYVYMYECMFVCRNFYMYWVKMKSNDILQLWNSHACLYKNVYIPIKNSFIHMKKDGIFG